MKVSFVNKVKFHIKKLYRKAKLPGDDSSQKMPSCTCLKASYTLEAAVIFPLVAGFFVFILFFFRVVQVESQVKAALYYSSRMSALASSANDSSVVSVATAEVLFRSGISDSKHIDTYVSGGKYGVSLLGSKMDGTTKAVFPRFMNGVRLLKPSSSLMIQNGSPATKAGSSNARAGWSQNLLPAGLWRFTRGSTTSM